MSRRMSRRSLLARGAALVSGIAAARAGIPASVEILAPTPPMGWMSWNQFGPEVSDALLREMADAMIASGMAGVGYRYICIDDLWHGGRSREGYLYPDSRRFPNGIKAVADYMHSKGLKLGIYSDAADRTCEEQPGSLGYEEKDAQTFASWGVDYLKYDYCFAPEDQETAIRRYSAMAKALRNTGRPIVFSICEWGPRKPWLWAAKAGGNLWRTTWDIRDLWQGRFDDTAAGVMDILDRQAGLEEYAGPGHWNDPDMLVVGLYGKGMYTEPKGYAPCNDTEYRSHMSLWCMLAAPLHATCDLRKMNAATREILTHPEVIAINQDPFGRQASRVLQDGGIEVWRKPLSHGAAALALLNRTGETRTITVKFADVRFQTKQRVRDLWRRSELGTLTNSISCDVESHGTTLLRLTPG